MSPNPVARPGSQPMPRHVNGSRWPFVIPQLVIVFIAQFAAAFQGQAKGILGMFNMFSGGAVQRMAIFSLNVSPYISASIIVQLLGTVYPPWEKLRKEGGEAAQYCSSTTPSQRSRQSTSTVERRSQTASALEFTPIFFGIWVLS